MTQEKQLNLSNLSLAGGAGKDTNKISLVLCGFMENKTSWSPEWVSPNKTKIVGFKYIKDLLTEIKNLEKNGKYIIHYYKNTASYNSFVEGRILK